MSARVQRSLRCTRRRQRNSAILNTVTALVSGQRPYVGTSGGEEVDGSGKYNGGQAWLAVAGRWPLRWSSTRRNRDGVVVGGARKPYCAPTTGHPHLHQTGCHRSLPRHCSKGILAAEPAKLPCASRAIRYERTCYPRGRGDPLLERALLLQGSRPRPRLLGFGAAR